MGSIFSIFILPQAFALLNNPAQASQEAIARFLLMSCLCTAMCWFGYRLPPNKKLITKLDISFDNQKFLQVGIIFVIISYIFTFLLYQLNGLDLYTRYWTGIATIYNLFTGLIYPGLTIILISTFQRPSLSKIILILWAMIIPLQTIIIFGRREPTAILILTIGLSMYFTRRYVPSRWLIIVGISLSMLIIPLAHSYRMISASGDWSQILELRPAEYFDNYLKQGETLEVRNAALLMDAAVQTGQYGFGTDYWNRLIFSFVPAQIVGTQLKESLQIKLYENNLEKLYNYGIPPGSTITGIGDSFVQFDYFGCLFFFAIGYIFKNLWISAKYKNSIISQIFYTGLVSPAMLSVTHQSKNFLPEFLLLFFFLIPMILYSRNKPNKIFKINNSKS